MVGPLKLSKFHLPQLITLVALSVSTSCRYGSSSQWGRNMDDRQPTLSALSAVNPGCDRATWVKTAMAAKAAGLTLDDFVDWSTPADNFGGERECASVWKSVDVGPVKAGTLYYLATAAGWCDPVRPHQAGHNGHAWKPDAHASQSRIRSHTKSNAEPVICWNRFEPASVDHPYIAAKRGCADGLRVVPIDDALTISGERMAGWLAVPVVNESAKSAASNSSRLRTLPAH